MAGTDANQVALFAHIQALTDALTKSQQSKDKPKPNATIQIKPNIAWPSLGDNDYDVEQFFLEFEEIVGLANDGAGMGWAEMVRVLGNTLKGSRHKAYSVVYKAGRHLLGIAPGELYQKVKVRLMEFKEGVLEKQQRLDQEWRHLFRGKKSALEFAPVFEEIVSNLELAGVGKSERDVLLHYLSTIPAAHR